MRCRSGNRWRGASCARSSRNRDGERGRQVGRHATGHRRQLMYPEYRNRGAGIREPLREQAAGPLYAPRAAEGRRPVKAVLPGAEHREAGASALRGRVNHETAQPGTPAQPCEEAQCPRGKPFTARHVLAHTTKAPPVIRALLKRHILQPQRPALMGGEQLARPREADPLERPLREVRGRKLLGKRVRVWIAGDLAQDEVAAPGISQDERRPILLSGQIREWKPNQDYGAGCR